MVKSELIQKLSEDASIPPKIAEIAVNTVFSAMTDSNFPNGKSRLRTCRPIQGCIRPWQPKADLPWEPSQKDWFI